tara:strand:- start:1051 stop:2286 length:1236 start_codon:yes stop_codon:yes gene_type:complete
MKKLVQYFIPSSLPNNEEVQRKARLTAGTLLLLLVSTLQYSSISLYIGFDEGVMSQFGLFVLTVITLVLYKLNVTRSILLGVYFTACTISIAGAVFYTGGSSSIVFMFLATTPITALMVWSVRGSKFTLVVVVIVEVLIYYLDQDGFVFPNNVKEEYRSSFFLSCNLGFVLLLYWISYIFESAKSKAINNFEKKNEELAEEKAKSDRLLLNILPETVADELKETGQAKAHLYKDVSVLFLDIIGFTTISEKLTPQELVNELNLCFTEFDHIVKKNGVEKIKTVGDAYIAASGLPVENENNAEVAVATAIEMMASIEKYKLKRESENKPHFTFRCGIHSGTVVAGIVGVEKFAYDIWGDAVNTAARMEQNSEAGKVNISHQTYESVKDKFKIDYRGEIDAKNKGLIKMYFVS